MLVWLGFVFVVVAIALARTPDAAGTTDYVEILFVVTLVATLVLAAVEGARTLRRRGWPGRRRSASPP